MVKGMKLNTDKEHVKKIQDKLIANDNYCPCYPHKTEDTQCPCKYIRQYQSCRCGLYVRE